MYISENVLVAGYGFSSYGSKPQCGVMHSRQPSPFCISFLELHSYYIVTCRWVRVTKITGSRSDDCIYWCSFTITLNSDSLQSLTLYEPLHSLLDCEHLPFCYDERRIPANTLNCLERCLSLENALIQSPLVLATIF
jgi:hypothetical protein